MFDSCVKFIIKVRGDGIKDYFDYKIKFIIIDFNYSNL